ncbi:MAG: 16S rRNA (adenine(1518)-N(6)/adenine(1519)-N(6))-dimethyltransferase RsmA [Candidatus Micrarchaeia archaeon]
MHALETRPKKSLGQNFLVNRHIAEIEAVHAVGKNVLELGAGTGVLTNELCKVANKVVAVEIDPLLFGALKRRMLYKNLKLVNKDFFKASPEELELGSTDLMISNIPYKLSSKVIEFLSINSMQAVLCLQKEFVEHMVAHPGSRKYSRLSVMAQLSFSMTKIADVSKGNFSPVPKVDSSIIYLKPKQRLSKDEATAINLLMQHKKKTLRNALRDALKGIFNEAEIEAIAKKTGVADARVFKLDPDTLLGIAKLINKRRAELGS